MMIGLLLLVCGVLLLALGVVGLMLHSLVEGFDGLLNGLTKILGPGVVHIRHKHAPKVSYTLIISAVGCFGLGIYHIL